MLLILRNPNESVWIFTLIVETLKFNNHFAKLPEKSAYL